MFERAVVAINLTEVPVHILSCLGGVRQLGVRDLTLVQALNTRHVNRLHEQLPRLSHEEMEAQKSGLEALGFRARVADPPGLPHYEVPKLARQLGAGLIIVFSTADSLLGDVFSGSVAYDIGNRSRIPVLVMKARMSEEQFEVVCPNMVANIFHPTDFSSLAARAFEVLIDLVRVSGSRVTLAHVHDQYRIAPHLLARLPEFDRIDQERLEGLRRRLLEAGAAAVETRLSYGVPTQELLALIGSEPHSLIVMGGQGRGFIGELLLGSVSHFLMRRAPVPMLLVPAG